MIRINLKEEKFAKEKKCNATARMTGLSQKFNGAFIIPLLEHSLAILVYGI